MRARHHRTSRGSALAEFALVLPPLLMLLLGIVQLGRAVYAYHFVAVAARKATRYAIVRGASCSSFSSACPATAADIESFVRNLNPPAMTPADLSVTTVWNPSNAPGSTVTITVQYPFSLDIPFVPSATLPLQSTSQMVIAP
ncbi:MAG: TadE/TadG family type IV pilus assembly protein [Terriglobales bacterium]